MSMIFYFQIRRTHDKLRKNAAIISVEVKLDIYM